MSLIERSCQGAPDQALMIELAHRAPGGNLYVIDLPYRLCSWTLDEAENGRLWFDEAGQLRAWAVVQAPFWCFDICTDPHGGGESFRRTLYERALDWAIGRAQALSGDPVYGRPAWFVNALDGQQDQMAALELRGFADQMDVPVDPWSKVRMARPTGAAVDAKPLPPGCRIRALDRAEDVAAYVSLHQAAFDSRTMTADWRAAVVRHPACRTDLNLAVEAADGTLAAFCIGWFDPAAYGGRPAGQIEPLGVHPDQRGLGLAKNLLGECFRRLLALGAEDIYIETDNYRDEAFRLYESVGFRVLQQVRVFRQDF